MYSRILLAVDQSEFSARAIATTLDLAACAQASVLLLHVLPPANSFYPILSPFTPLEASGVAELSHAHEEARRVADEFLELTRQSFENGGVACTARLIEGYPAEAICQQADSEAVDLIVLGRRGLGAVASFFLGGVSLKVITHTHHSVLLVP